MYVHASHTIHSAHASDAADASRVLQRRSRQVTAAPPRPDAHTTAGTKLIAAARHRFTMKGRRDVSVSR
jgi:hypothetical protein